MTREFINPMISWAALKWLSHHPSCLIWTLDWRELETITYTGRK